MSEVGYAIVAPIPDFEFGTCFVTFRCSRSIAGSGKVNGSDTSRRDDWYLPGGG